MADGLLNPMEEMAIKAYNGADVVECMLRFALQFTLSRKNVTFSKAAQEAGLEISENIEPEYRTFLNCKLTYEGVNALIEKYWLDPKELLPYDLPLPEELEDHSPRISSMGVAPEEAELKRSLANFAIRGLFKQGQQK